MIVKDGRLRCDNRTSEISFFVYVLHFVDHLFM